MASAMKGKVNISDMGIQINKFRQTKSGDILLELDRGQQISDKLCTTLSAAVGEMATITKLPGEEKNYSDRIRHNNVRYGDLGSCPYEHPM